MIKVRSDEDVDEEEEGDDTCFRDLISSIGDVIKVWETPAICVLLGEVQREVFVW